MLISAFLEELAENLGKWNIILGLALAVSGVILTFSAFGIVKIFSKGKEINKDSGSVVVVKVVGMILCIAGLVFTIIL